MKEKLWNANYIKVMTTNFLLYFAFYLLTPLLPLYLSEKFWSHERCDWNCAERLYGCRPHHSSVQRICG